ncbi:DAK2 domain-containing protein [Brevibacterium litoralis]|uniref:DAK2 domain-containing protein n=1 Tax=Brevibacterium litoralis TaxID=3138935 RepID=UPI0032EDAA61
MNRPMDPARLNARLAARWAKGIVDRMRRDKARIDDLNVFPVPDGDTGSNMYHTVRSAHLAVERLEGPASLTEVVEAMANGALRGARGNSGLILAVALRGVADGLSGTTVLEPEVFASALALAAHRAREAVADPVDGTMLTVLEAMAEEAREAAADGADVLTQIRAVRARSRSALRETTGQLAVLRENSVVDAGSTGIVELFDLLYLTVSGEPLPEAGPAAEAPSASDDRTGAQDSAPPDTPGAGTPEAGAPDTDLRLVERGEDGGPAQDGHHDHAHPHGGTGLELVFHLTDPKPRTKAVSRLLTKVGGDSIVVAWPMVHVHVPHGAAAQKVIDGVARFGPADLRIEDLSVSGAPTRRTTLLAPVAGLGAVLAVARAGAHAVDTDVAGWTDRLREIVEDTEHTVVLTGTREHVEALVAAWDEAAVAESTSEDGTTTESTSTNTDTDDEDAAEDGTDGAGGQGASAAEDLVPEAMRVVAGSVPGLLAALAVHDPAGEPGQVVADMVEAIEDTRVGQVAVGAAPQPTDRGLLGGLGTRQAPTEYRVVLDGRVRATHPDAGTALLTLVSGLLADDGDLLTLVTGGQLPAAAVEVLRKRLAESRPDVEVEHVDTRHAHTCAWAGVE